MKYINTYNESIRHFLKPKSEDDIKKTLGELTPTEKLEKGSKHGLLWLVKQAIDEGVDPSYKDNIALKIVSSTGHVDILKYLLNIGVDPSINNNFAIRLSSKEGHLENVKELLKDDRVDPSYEDNFALTWASQRNHSDICIELLKDKRVTKILSKDRKLLYGTKHGLLWLVKQAIDEGANPVYEGNIPIRRASKFGYYDIVKLLLNEADKKERLEGIYKSIKTLGGGKDGLSAIEFAFYNYHIDIVELFLEHPKCEEYLNDDMIKKYKDNIEYYKKHKKYLINNKFDVYNESIRHLLKPKSEDDIIDKLDKLTSFKKLDTIFKYDLRHLTNDDELKQLLDDTNNPDVLNIILNNNLEHLVDNDKIKLLLNNHRSPLDLTIDHPRLSDLIEDDYFLKDQLYSLYTEDLVKYLFKYPHLKDLFNDKEMKEIEDKFKNDIFNVGDTRDILDAINRHDLLGFFSDDEINQLEIEAEEEGL